MRRKPTRTQHVYALLSSGVLLAACAAPIAPSATATRNDEFAVVRATSEAAYAAGNAALERSELDAALVLLDQAKLNDPDNRPEIAAAISETVRRIQLLPTPTPPPTRTPIPSPTSRPTPEPGVPTPRPPSPVAGQPALPAGFTVFGDEQGRFTVAAPSAWQVVRNPAVEFGVGVVSFKDPNNRAELAIAVDPEARMPSPELYAARMDLAMQQLTGYALESVLSGQLADSASVRRMYAVTQRDSTGRVFEARGIQVTLLRGVTPYILTGSAPKAEFASFERTFTQIMDTLSFR